MRMLHTTLCCFALRCSYVRSHLYTWCLMRSALLPVSQPQPRCFPHKLAVQSAAKLVVACVVGCGWAFGAYALPSNLWYCMQHMPNVCLQDPKRAPKGVTMAHSRRYVRRVDDADVWHELSYLGSAFDADAYPIPGRKDLGMRYPYMSSRTQT